MKREELIDKGKKLSVALEKSIVELKEKAKILNKARDVYNQKVIYFNSLTPPSWIWQTKRIENYNYAYAQVMYYKNKLDIAKFNFTTAEYENKRMLVELQEINKILKELRKE